MRLVLLGDIHVGQRFPPPWHLLGKPIVAQWSFWFPRRRRRFDPVLLGPVVARAASLRPDAVLLTGDLTTTALRGEFTRAAKALAPLFAAAPAVGIPGNHDRYTFRATLLREMERALPGLLPATFPAMLDLAAVVQRGKRVGDPPTKDSRPDVPSVQRPTWQILTLDAARPTLLNSRGRLGPEQLRQARSLIDTLTPDDGLLVMCHYTLGKPPPQKPSPWHHRLADKDELLALLAGCRARVLFMHGHVHYPWVWPRPEPELHGMIDVNAGAPTQVSDEFPFGQGFWEIELPESPREAIRFQHHVATGRTPGEPDDPNGGLTWVTRTVLGPAAPPAS
ncbi:MAG: metallophosphoesterase [Planctomycetota bacterium]|nr:metallophosphoesterase [Planctomycetota bacterium]